MPKSKLKSRITIPLGATVRVKRVDGTVDAYAFRGTDGQGPVYEDAKGRRVSDIGLYVDIAVDCP